MYLYIVCEMPLVFQLGSLLRSANLGLQETNLTYSEYVLRPREQSSSNLSTVGGCCMRTFPDLIESALGTRHTFRYSEDISRSWLLM
jgi:hypothetical protein